MAYPISDVTRRVVYTGSAGVGPYSFTFEVLANTDIQVYKNTTLLTLTTNYTVTINANGTGSVTLVVAATGADTITIVGDRAIQRATDFVTGGDLFANTLNDEFDSLVIFAQQVDEKADRGLKAPVTDPTDVNMVLPVKATRLGTVLAFNATTGNPEAGPSIASVTTVAAQSANINTVATNIASVNTVAGNSTNINTVAGISGNVTTVAGISANVTTVAGISSNVTTVAGNSANVTTVAGISGNVTTVAGISANVTTVATNIASVNTAATNIAAIIDAPNQATAAAASAAAAAASAASGMYSAVQDKSANYTVVAGDAGDLIRVTTTSGAITITLPTISTVEDGFKVAIVKWTSDGNAVSVVRSSTNTINGATSYNLGNQYSSATFVADLETGQWFAVASGLGVSNVAVDAFSGNNSTTAFTLSGDPGSENNTQVYVSGIYQEKDTYSVSGTTLTFSTAPPTGTSNIEVVWTAPLAIGTPSDGTVTTAKIASSVTLTTPTIDTITSAAATALTLKSAGTTAITVDASQKTSLVNDATINGQTVGKGGGNVATNTAHGVSALTANSTGGNNTAIGYQALLSNTTAVSNSAFGVTALKANTTGDNNTALGFEAMIKNTTGALNVAVGLGALHENTTASNNTAVGTNSLYSNTTGTQNVAMGRDALLNSTTANNNVAIGYRSLYGGSTAADNVGVGYFALYSLSSGYVNTAVGLNASSGITTGANNTCIGAGAGNGSSPSGNLTTQNDRICLGDNNVTNAYIKVSWTVTSDARDKADIVDSRYGLNFVNSLRPVEYKWDMRSNYEEGQTPDGTHKESKTNLGFLAQEVIEVEKANGGVAGDLLVADDEMDGLLRITETKMIPVLVKAIQELKAINDTQAETINALTARVTALEGN